MTKLTLEVLWQFMSYFIFAGYLGIGNQQQLAVKKMSKFTPWYTYKSLIFVIKGIPGPCGQRWIMGVSRREQRPRGAGGDVGPSYSQAHVTVFRARLMYYTFHVHSSHLTFFLCIFFLQSSCCLNMRKYLGRLSCMRFSSPVAILNGACYFWPTRGGILLALAEASPIKN